jgi:peptidoglycan/LPS O-acetylase OafA/YrhL
LECAEFALPLNGDEMVLDRLRRVTRDGRWIPEIDGLRFVAISSVILFHLYVELLLRPQYRLVLDPKYWWLGRILENGERGVRLFFVISGLILALPFARHLLCGAKPVSLGKYYLRRVTRLEPPYFLSLLLIALLTFVYWHRLDPGYSFHLLASLFYQHNLIYGDVSTVSPVAWSLEIEIQFYLLAPLIMQCFRIRPTWVRRPLVLLFIVCISAAQMVFPASLRVNLSILFYLQYFLVGLLIADVFVLDLDRMRVSWIWDLAGIMAVGAIFWPSAASPWPHALLWIPMGLLCIAAMRSHGLRPFFANQWIAVIGGMCYSIYLLHFACIAVLMKATRHALLPGGLFPANYPIQALLVVVPTFAIAAAFFVFVERPCMDPNWPSKLWHRMTGRRESEVAVLDAGGLSD